MCCFSGNAQVSATRIYARMLGAGRQGLVYQMRVAAQADLAMILPIPTPAGAAVDAVRFIDLSGYRGFFADLQRAFPEDTRSATLGAPAAAPAPLPVHDVGDFEASFVPSQADFTRLDRRFVIDAALWARLPTYRDWGFAVFQLKFGTRPSLVPQPMAFDFPSRFPRRLFFPTVHIHDGTVPAVAEFDHTLFAQVGESDPFSTRMTLDTGSERREVAFTESPGLADGHVTIAETRGLVAAKGHLHRLSVVGRFRNADILLGAA
jgi:hypothetical protein